MHSDVSHALTTLTLTKHTQRMITMSTLCPLVTIIKIYQVLQKKNKRMFGQLFSCVFFFICLKEAYKLENARIWTAISGPGQFVDLTLNMVHTSGCLYSCNSILRPKQKCTMWGSFFFFFFFLLQLYWMRSEHLPRLISWEVLPW